MLTNFLTDEGEPYNNRNVVLQANANIKFKGEYRKSTKKFDEMEN